MYQKITCYDLFSLSLLPFSETTLVFVPIKYHFTKWLCGKRFVCFCRSIVSSVVHVNVWLVCVCVRCACLQLLIARGALPAEWNAHTSAARKRRKPFRIFLCPNRINSIEFKSERTLRLASTRRMDIQLAHVHFLLRLAIRQMDIR